MSGRPIRHTQGVTVIGGGAVAAGDLRAALEIAPLLVAADGGADRARALGHAPDWLVGDLDSASSPARAALPSARILHVAEQDSTDFAKCLARIDAPLVMAVGFTGLRLDHTLAALTVLVGAGRCSVSRSLVSGSLGSGVPISSGPVSGAPVSGDGPAVVMLSSDDVIAACPPRLVLDLAPGMRVSLFPMGPARGRSTGLEWPLDGIALSPDGRVGTSNRATGPVGLWMEGPVLVMLPREALGALLAGLRG